MLYFIGGIIVGLLLNPAKQKAIEIIHSYKEKEENQKAEFFEPISEKERFLQAKTIDDTLK